METGDGLARRKLNFTERSFAKKTFYVDVRSVPVRNKVVKYIHDLGGSIETFLSKDIHVFVTDTKITKTNKRADRVQELQCQQYGSSHHESPSSGSKCLPLSRGKALLLKARGNGSENSSTCDRGLSSNVMIHKATDMGLKIEHVHTFLKSCKKLNPPRKLSRSKNGSLGDIVPLTWDNDSIVLKVEDASKLYKPLHKQFSKLPTLYADNGGGSPFDGPVVLEKPECVKTTNKAKSTRFYTVKGGYCEMCDCYFKNSIKEHLLSERHTTFVNNEANFSGVESVVDKLPNLSKFLSKFCIPKVRSSPGNDVHNVENVDANNNTDGMSIENDKTCVDDEVPMEANIEEKNFTSSDTIIYEYNEDMTKGNNCFLESNTFDNNDCGGSDNIQLPVLKMFSEDSCDDSQTDVLKNMINKWTLQDDRTDANKISSFSIETNGGSMCYATPISNLELKDLNNCEINTLQIGSVVPGLPKPLGIQPIDSGSEPEICMSFSTPQAEPPRSSFGEMPLLSPQVYREDDTTSYPTKSEDSVKKVKSKKRKYEDDLEDECTYYTKKTDDTKLKIKLCKVTPARQKTNLKMFWKVRKTGDCRLVFSAGKSRKPLQVSNDDNIMRHSPDKKRQRMLQF